MTDTMLRMVALLVIAAVCVVLASWARVRDHLASRRVHRRLAAVNGLSAQESAWLWRLARVTSPERPAMVFVRPSLLLSGAAAADPALAETVRAKLFSG